GAEASVQWVGGPETAPFPGGAESVLVLSGDVLFEPSALAPLLDKVDPGTGPIAAALSGGGEACAAVCLPSVLPVLVARLTEGVPLAQALRRVGAPPAAS